MACPSVSQLLRTLLLCSFVLGLPRLHLLSQFLVGLFEHGPNQVSSRVHLTSTPASLLLPYKSIRVKCCIFRIFRINNLPGPLQKISPENVLTLTLLSDKILSSWRTLFCNPIRKQGLTLRPLAPILDCMCPPRTPVLAARGLPFVGIGKE